MRYQSDEFQIIQPRSCFCLRLAGLCDGALPAALPAVSLYVKLAAPIRTLDDALPLGNSLLGGLLWGEKR